MLGEVVHRQRLSPHFMRIVFATPATVGGAGETFDQRIRIGFPAPGNEPWLPSSEDWYDEWVAAPKAERGCFRTFSVRAVERLAEETRVTVDFVLHGFGPATSWVAQAEPGDRVSMLLPRRGLAGVDIEFLPTNNVVLAGDETAAPAIARILEDLPRSTRGVAFIEVPTSEDSLDIAAPDQVQVFWLPRNGAEHGQLLTRQLTRYVTGGQESTELADLPRPAANELVWETPTFSALGEELPARMNDEAPFYWLAGECRVVAGLRRKLVRDFSVPRANIAFMGYWRLQHQQTGAT